MLKQDNLKNRSVYKGKTLKVYIKMTPFHMKWFTTQCLITKIIFYIALEPCQAIPWFYGYQSTLHSPN